MERCRDHVNGSQFGCAKCLGLRNPEVSRNRDDANSGDTGCATEERSRNPENCLFPIEPSPFYASVAQLREDPMCAAGESSNNACPGARIRACAYAQPGMEDLPGLLGIPALREHQREAIEAAAAGQDVLAICPTGSGKTAAFLGAGLLRGGLTLIVSPLRSLIADQHRRLTALGLPVRIWNSDVKDAYKDECVDLLNGGWSGFFYTTPESLKGRELATALKDRVNLAVIDEAHCCLRERGFRVQYGWLGGTLDKIGPAVRFACTATLPGADQDALVRTLHLRNPAVIVLPVARENLSIHIVERYPSALAHILNRHRGEAGIIFAATVATACNLHARLVGHGRNVGLYHGRLAVKDKKAAQSAFMAGDIPVMVATDAFLLGIDKADIRFIVHYDYPKSVEDWAQGFGRAGRDGLPAHVYGCFRSAPEGRASRMFLLQSSYPAVEKIRSVWEYLTSAPWHDASQADIVVGALGNDGKYAASAVFGALKRHGLVADQPNPEDKRRRLYRANGDFGAADWDSYSGEAKQTFRRFETLCRLVQMPESAIPTEIDKYFEGEHERQRVALSAHGDWPASWDMEGTDDHA